jgi:hypothetical protein
MDVSREVEDGVLRIGEGTESDPRLDVRPGYDPGGEMAATYRATTRAGPAGHIGGQNKPLRDRASRPLYPVSRGGRVA